MALRPDRQILGDGTVIEYFMNETAERGEIVVIRTTTSGSGAAMDQANMAVITPASISGVYEIGGLLMNDVVNLDLTRQHLNQHKDEVQLGGKVTLLRKGIVTTNILDSGTATSANTPAALLRAGAPAYMGRGARTSGATEVGWLTPTRPSVAGIDTSNVQDADVNSDDLLRVGTFLSTKDSDGYAKVQISL